MAFKRVPELSSNVTIKLGGKDASGKSNPTSLEGYYLGRREAQSDYGAGVIHFFQTQEGNVGVWGKTNMNRLLSDERLGQMVRVTFTGMGKAAKGKSAPYNYSVEYDEDETTDVSGIDLNTSAHEDAEDPSTDDDSPSDEIQPPKAVAPARPLATPNASSAAKVQALLNRNRTSA